MKAKRNLRAKKGGKQDAKRLIELRSALALSQRQLAEEWYVSVGAIANYENGTRPIPGAVLKLMEIYSRKFK